MDGWMDSCAVRERYGRQRWRKDRWVSLGDGVGKKLCLLYLQVLVSV